MNRQNLVVSFSIGALSVLGISAIASVPKQGSIATPQEVSEIRVQRQQELHADQDLKRLSQLQGRYRENMPLRRRAQARLKPAQPLHSSQAGATRKAPAPSHKNVRTRR